MITKKVLITGIVQGVGFRPFVYNLAQKFGLKGYVKNINSNVSILIQSENASKMVDFIRELRRNPPQNAIISKVRIHNQKNKKIFKNFVIIESEKNHNADFYSAIPRDLALCDECEKELKNPRNRRFGYAFINCINCGPRWSIIESLPYDRERTAMKDFQMCESCEREYRNVKNRRFHAQPNSCGKCGIKMSLFDNKGGEIILDSGDSCESGKSKSAIDSRESHAKGESHDSQSKIFDFLRTQIKNGKIICFKGIGGFNLICAVESNAIATLRIRKNRPRKPFAIMFGDIKCAKNYFHISKSEENALLSPSAPIVLLSKPKVKLPQNLSYNLNTYGVIIAYSALHKLLFKGYSKPLIFTSANLSGESIITQKATAQAKIAHIFDYLVNYNRAIINPIDDSLKRILRGGKVATLRAGRGDYPLLKISKFKSNEVILALGANQKSQIAIFFSNYVLISRYIGDLDNIDSIFALQREISFLLKLYNLTPSVILCDCHRFYESSKIALNLVQKFGAKVARIYHHRAHFYSNLFCNNLAFESGQNILGVVFDGTGFGEDGTIWGGEFFLMGNSPLELHSADLANFGRSQTISLVSAPKIPKSYESQTENPSVVLNNKNGESTNQAQNCNISSLHSIPRHTERSEVSKSSESNQMQNAMAQKRIGKSHRFAQSKKILNDSQVAKMDSSLTAFAQNDELNIKPRRIAHFATFPLIGGESAIKNISKIALGVLFSVYGRAIPLESRFKSVEPLYQMQQKGINSPQTSSVGRIYDFVAFMCGLESQSFEGESGGYVESLFSPKITAHYDFEIHNGVILLQKIVRGIVSDYETHDSRKSRTIIATKFTNTLAQIILQIALENRANRPNLKVIFSGGVFANKVLCDKIALLLKAHKIAHYFHSEIPTNDGGIAVGQIVAYLRGDFEMDFENDDFMKSGS